MEVASNDSPWSASTQRSVYSAVSAAALVGFEYIITFDREIDFLRGRKISWAKCIFLLNRYGSILNCLAIMAMALPTTDPMRCLVITRMVQACNTLLLMVWIAFSCLRTYAINATNWKATASVLVTGLVAIGLEMFVIPQTSISLSANSRCEQSIPGVSISTVNMFSTVGRAFALFSNAIVLAATWLGTRSTIRTGKEVGLSTVFASFLFWNGLRTFVFLVAINLAQIVLSCFHFDGVMFLDLPRAMISICVSRFFLSLHKLGTHDSDEGLDFKSFSSIPTFVHGQSIRPTEWK